MRDLAVGEFVKAGVAKRLDTAALLPWLSEMRSLLGSLSAGGRVTIRCQSGNGRMVLVGAPDRMRGLSSDSAG